MIKKREEGFNSEPVPFDIDQDPIEYPKQLNWKLVYLIGKFIHNKEIIVGPRTNNGKPGYHVITPLQTKNGDRVLINRGFIPSENAQQNTRLESLTEDEVKVVGTCREISSKPPWVPQNSPETRTWIWIDIPFFAKITNSLPFLIEQIFDQENPKKIPIGGQVHQELPNSHLSYAIIWFSLTAFMTVMSISIIRKGGIKSNKYNPRPQYHKSKKTNFF